MPDSDSEAFESADEDVIAEEKNKNGMKFIKLIVQKLKFNFFKFQLSEKTFCKNLKSMI